jgi:hypothetical protein
VLIKLLAERLLLSAIGGAGAFRRALLGIARSRQTSRARGWLTHRHEKAEESPHRKGC